MGNHKIPEPVIACVADVLGSHYYNHTRLDTLFEAAGAPGSAPGGNCVQKCMQWLKNCNDAQEVDALHVLGKVLKDFMEGDRSPSRSGPSPPTEDQKKRVRDTLADHGLSYASGGFILDAGLSPASELLEKLVRAKNLPALQKEFERRLKTVESNPPDAVTAACNLLEALFKEYIEDEGLKLPAQKTVRDLYKVVRGHLCLDPAKVAEQDLKRIFSGLISLVEGIGALRTHTGSAHGHGRQGYQLELRYARLAINCAHALAIFILETWSHNKKATA